MPLPLRLKHGKPFRLTVKLLPRKSTIHYNMKKPRKITREENEELSLEHVRIALSGIDRVLAFIHSVRLRTDNTSLKHIYSVIGNGRPINKEDNKSHRMPQYEKMSYHLFEGRKIYLYFSPIQDFMPKFMLLIPNHTHRILRKLNDSIPDLEVSLAEYALDLRCKDNKSASMLFYVLRRYMYFHHRADTSMIGGKFDGIDVSRKTNAVYHVWQKSKCRTTDIKIYERGNNKCKKGQGWPYKYIDRVRIEFLARSRTFTKKLKIASLSDFLKDNKFSNFANDKIDFRIFVKSKYLPKFSQDYLAKDRTGNIESFQQEYFQAKSFGINLSLCTAVATFMSPLKEMMTTAIDYCERRWRRGYKVRTFRKR